MLKNLLILGAGRAGQMRAQINDQHKLFNLIGMIDPCETSQKNSPYPHYKSLTDFYKDNKTSDIDGIWISSPTRNHFEQIKTFAKLAKPIYVEKPLTDSIENTIEAFKISNEYKFPIHTGWQRRSCPSFTPLKSIIEQKGWVSLNLNDKDNPFPTASQLISAGDLISDCTGHAINQVLYLTDGEVPYKVHATGTSSYGTDVIDNVEITMTYKNRQRRSLDDFYQKEKFVKISFSRSSPNHVYECIAELNTDNEIIVVGENGDQTPWSFPDRFSDGFRLQMEYFKQIVESENPMAYPPISPLEHDILTSKLVDAAKESFYRQRSVYLNKDGTAKNSEDSSNLFVINSDNFLSKKYVRKDLVQEKNLKRQFGVPDIKESGKIDFDKEILYNDEVESVFYNDWINQNNDRSKNVLRAGKPLFLNRPLTGITKIVEQAEASMVPLFIGLVRRYDSEFSKLKNDTSENDMPKKILIENYQNDAFSYKGDWVRQSLTNHLVHDFDTQAQTYPNCKISIDNYEIVSDYDDLDDNDCEKEIIFTGKVENKLTQQETDLKIIFKGVNSNFTEKWTQTSNKDQSKSYGYSDIESSDYVYQEAMDKMLQEFGKTVKGLSYDSNRNVSYIKVGKIISQLIETLQVEANADCSDKTKSRKIQINAKMFM